VPTGPVTLTGGPGARLQSPPTFSGSGAVPATLGNSTTQQIVRQFGLSSSSISSVTILPSGNAARLINTILQRPINSSPVITGQYQAGQYRLQMNGASTGVMQAARPYISSNSSLVGVRTPATSSELVNLPRLVQINPTGGLARGIENGGFGRATQMLRIPYSLVRPRPESIGATSLTVNGGGQRFQLDPRLLQQVIARSSGEFRVLPRTDFSGVQQVVAGASRPNRQQFDPSPFPLPQAVGVRPQMRGPVSSSVAVAALPLCGASAVQLMAANQARVSSGLSLNLPTQQGAVTNFAPRFAPAPRFDGGTQQQPQRVQIVPCHPTTLPYIRFAATQPLPANGVTRFSK